MSAESQAQGGGQQQSLEGDSLLDEILSETKMAPGNEGYEVAKRGVQALIAELVTPKREGEKVDKAFVDALIAEIDQKLSRQLDEILHAPAFMKLESALGGPGFGTPRAVEQMMVRPKLEAESVTTPAATTTSVATPAPTTPPAPVAEAPREAAPTPEPAKAEKAPEPASKPAPAPVTRTVAASPASRSGSGSGAPDPDKVFKQPKKGKKGNEYDPLNPSL